MPEHERFEELCSLAVLGEVSPEEMRELHAHLRDCTSCKSSFSDFSSILDCHLPLAHGGRPGVEVSLGVVQALRQTTLRRVAEQGLHLSPDAIRGENSHFPKLRHWFNNLGWGIRVRWPRIAISMALLAIIVGAVESVHLKMRESKETRYLWNDLRQAKTHEAAIEEQLRQTERSRSDAAPVIAQLEQKLSVNKSLWARLEQEHRVDRLEIQSLQSQVAVLATEKVAISQRTARSEAERVKLGMDLDQLRASASDKDIQLAEQQYRIKELGKQLEAQKTAIDRERELMTAGRDIRDLMTARNLHIIDVHDQDARGESRPFGRIFLTDGKRLIFYAYDLDTLQIKNASFQVWGQRTDGSKGAVNLGIFYVDDKKQSRWALKVEDPNLLRMIDSVFVTVEPSGGTSKPSGKKLMYAYLRNPINHP